MKNVVDEKSFVEFLTALATDRESEAKRERVLPSSPHGPGANGWDNGSIEQFLEAAAAWAKDSFDSSAGASDATNIWRRCAEILYAGKLYE